MKPPMTTTIDCQVCHAVLTPCEIRKGWPIHRIEDAKLVCPACYGDDAFCQECGECLPANHGNPHKCAAQ